MLTSYLHAALSKARYEILPDDGTYYGEIPEFTGVFSSDETLEGCRQQLAEVLEEWILLRIHEHLPLPVVDGIELRISKVA